MCMSPKIKRNLTIAVFAFNIILAAITILAAYGGKFDPDTTTIPAILAMTFPGWVILTVMLLIADLLFFRRMTFIPLITIIVSLSPILAFSPLNLLPAKLTDKEKERSFTMMSYNVLGMADFMAPQPDPSEPPKRHCDLLEEMRAGQLNKTLSYILDTAPDLACLQEAPPAIPLAYHHVSTEQIDSLCTIFPHRTGYNGENVYSRFPLYPVDLRQPESVYSWFGGAMVDIMGHKTLVISVHLQSIGLNSEDKELFHELTEGQSATKVKQVKRQLLSKLSYAFKERASQARLLREQIDSLNVENVIIAGDFNDIPDCYALRLLAQDDFKSAFTIAGCGPTYTYHGNRFFFNIDHVLYRGNMKAVEYRRAKEGHSDHYPVEVRFVWND